MALVVLSGFVSEGYAGMFGFGKTATVHLSPPVSGVVKLEGDPLAGIEVYRTLDYDREYIDRAQTDENGQFEFPEKSIESRRPNNLGDETRVRQVIGLDYGGKNYLLWYTVPGGITPRRALSERLGNMRCELSTPEKEQVFANFEKPEFPHSTFSICRWD